MASEEKQRASVAIISHVPRLWVFLKELGLTGWAAGMIMAGLIAAVAWLHDALPLSVVFLMGLLAFAIFVFGYRQFVLANRITRFNPAKAAKLGRQLADFARDAHRTLVDWEQRNPRPPRSPSDNRNPHDDWQQDRDRDRARSLAFQERHMSQAVAYVVTLHGLGITPPFHAVAGADSRPSSLISYLGAVGHLLEAGLIEEARAINDERPSRGAIPFHLLT